MLKFNVDELYVLDLRDDFVMNRTQKLYEFLGQDPVKAYQLGICIEKWFKDLDSEQQYLHAKSLRHIKEDLKSYLNQMNYWTHEFPGFAEDEVNMLDLSAFVYNNIIWDPETEDTDRIKLALFLGMVTGRSINKDQEEEPSFNVDCK